MSTYETAYIRSNLEIAPGIWRMELYAPKIAATARPGQFINLYPDDTTLLLPRPISLSAILPECLRIVYRIVGNGTKQFSTMRSGEPIKVMGPLGNGFSLPAVPGHNIVIGGGLGIPPLLELVQQLKGSTEIFLGFSDLPFLVEEFRISDGKIHIATQTGNKGYRGNVIELLENISPAGNMIFACGPRPMLQAASVWAERNHIPIQVLMEERMACGLGACMGCAIKIRKSGETDWQYRKVCKDGPVFWGEEVVWNE